MVYRRLRLNAARLLAEGGAIAVRRQSLEGGLGAVEGGVGVRRTGEGAGVEGPLLLLKALQVQTLNLRQ